MSPAPDGIGRLSSAQLIERIKARTAIIGVMGLGYVGLPLLRTFHAAGFKTIGFDIDPAKVQMLQAGQCYLRHLGDEFIREMRESGRFEATSDFQRLSEPDAIVICVPTPLGRHAEPDLSFVQNTAEAVAGRLRSGQLVVLESTTYPGTTREIVLPILERAGGDQREKKAGQPSVNSQALRCGVDYFLAFSPEREDPGRKSHNTHTIAKLVGGIDEASLAVAVALYQAAVDKVVAVSSAEVAESAKLLENIYRCVNIALVNEMKVLLDRLGIDIWEVVDAAATKPFGFQAFYPGPGLGGHCIPIDPFYLTWKAREVGLPTRFIELAGEINQHMPDYVVQRLIGALNAHNKAVKGSRILVLGMAYKPDIDDIRESPSLELIEKLLALQAQVDYNDPHIPQIPRMRRHQLRLKSVAISPAALAGYDCILIATHHSAYNWREIAEHAQLIVDTRGVMRKVAHAPGKVVFA